MQLLRNLSYLLWAAEHMSLRSGDAQIKNTSLLLKNAHEHVVILNGTNLLREEI